MALGLVCTIGVVMVVPPSTASVACPSSTERRGKISNIDMRHSRRAASMFGTGGPPGDGAARSSALRSISRSENAIENGLCRASTCSSCEHFESSRHSCAASSSRLSRRSSSASCMHMSIPAHVSRRLWRKSRTTKLKRGRSQRKFVKRLPAPRSSRASLAVSASGSMLERPRKATRRMADGWLPSIAVTWRVLKQYYQYYSFETAWRLESPAIETGGGNRRVSPHRARQAETGALRA